MGPEDFIELEPVSDNGTENGGGDGSNPEPGEVNEEVSNGEGEFQHEIDMELDEGSTENGRTVWHERVEAVKAVVVEQTGQDSESGYLASVSSSAVENCKMEGSAISGVKRARVENDDQQPSVRVIYNSLTRESKRKLKDLLQQWSEWHAKHDSSPNDPPQETLECGEEIYFPALHVGQKKSSAVSFWIDSQTSKEQLKDCVHLDEDSVPLYDREYAFSSSSLVGSVGNARGILDASRCFNCGSYSHALKDCPKPRDNVAISNARNQHNMKKNSSSGTRGSSRYYETSAGKFDDLKPGVLGPETRQCLGIGEFDPPPWLQRMRILGYPPGYLETEAKDVPSGITIYADGVSREEHEDGEILDRSDPELPELPKKMTVEFPGINAPIPEDSDPRLWMEPPNLFSLDSSRNRSHQRSHHVSESSGRSHYHDQRRSRDNRDEGPSSSDYGIYGQRYDSNYLTESPRGHNLTPGSPHLGRSSSDRWRGSPVHSPHGLPSYSGFTGQSPHHYGISDSDRWRPEYSGSDSSSQWKDRYDHRHHHRRG